MRYLILLCLLCGNANAANILIIADSIGNGSGHIGNLGYIPYVREKIDNVLYPAPCNFLTDNTATGVNSGNSARLVACLPMWLAAVPPGTIVHFNAGMHDIHIAGCLTGGTSHQIEPSDYLMNLQTALNIIWAVGDIPIFATTTPVENRIHCHSNDDIIVYNHQAKLLMDSEGVPIDDLYSLMRPIQDQYHIPNDIHFTNAGYDVMSAQIVASIMAISGM
jgi:lysophospholipase L1-like esterase